MSAEVQPRPDGTITVAQAARLCQVTAVSIRNWIHLGYVLASGERVKLPIKRWDGRTILLDPVEVAKADHATRTRQLRAAARRAGVFLAVGAA
jgi:hypothetical protein